MLAAGNAPDTTLHVASTWPENWRETMAAGDPKFLERLQRFASPADVAKSYREIEGRVSSGKLKALAEPLPDNATHEQVTKWRTDNGLPTDAAAFVSNLALPGGVVPGEADAPLLNSFADAATRSGWTQQQYDQAIGWYYGVQDQLIADRQKGDEDFHIESTRALQGEWGNEFRPNLTRITQFLDAHFPKEVQNVLLTARGDDGSVLGNHPAVNKALLELAKFVNPVAGLMPNVPGATVANADTRIEEIQGMMRAAEGTDAWKAYWKGESGQKMQQEFRDLITARETMRERQGVR